MDARTDSHSHMYAHWGSVLCDVSQEDNGLLWKHIDWRTGHTEVRRARRLVVSFICTIANVRRHVVRLACRFLSFPSLPPLLWAFPSFLGLAFLCFLAFLPFCGPSLVSLVPRLLPFKGSSECITGSHLIALSRSSPRLTCLTSVTLSPLVHAGPIFALDASIIVRPFSVLAVRVCLLLQPRPRCGR